MLFSAQKTEDTRILEKLYEEKRTKLYCIANSILDNQMDAEDAVHNGFMNLTAKFGRYRDRSYEELGYILNAVVANAAKSMIRQKSFKEKFLNKLILFEKSNSQTEEDILDQIIHKHENAQVVLAVLQLAPDEQHLLHLQYELGMKPKEIGELLDMQSETVRKKLFTIRNRVANILEHNT